jgi:hypothetical protein
MDPDVLPMTATVLLSSVEHDALTQWCGWAAGELGNRNLAPQEVLRGLVARLVADPELAGDVLADLRERACLGDIREFARW